MRKLIIPENLRYTKTHEWIKIEENKIRIGITDYAQKQLTDIVYVELPKIGKELAVGDEICVVESVKSVASITSPVTGKIVEINKELENSPEILNSSCYDKGWIAIIEVSDLSEIDKLLTAIEYAEIIKKK